MIPSNDVLVAPNLLHLVHELLLEDGVDRLNGDSRTHLRHGKDINDRDRIVVDDFTNHETHDFEGHARAAMLHHLEQREGRDVNLLSRIILLHVDTGLGSLPTAHSLHSHQCT